MSLSMMLERLTIGCVIAATAAACSTTRDKQETAQSEGERTSAQRTDSSAEGQSGDSAKTSIMVVGCLQTGGGNALILTRVNEPARSVATGGTSDGAVVEREQLRSASGSYRVDPPPDVQATNMIGKEVQIIGTVTKNADLGRPSGGNDRRAQGADIKSSDLTRIAATSITATRDVCQGSESPAGNDPTTR